MIKETLELLHDSNTRVFKRYPEPEHDVPHNPWMVRRINAYAALSSAHLAGHLRTGMERAEMVTAYPVGMLMTKKIGV